MGVMKSIKDILRRKDFSSQGISGQELDEKTVIKVVEEAVLGEIKNLFSEDLREIYLKKKSLYFFNAFFCNKTSNIFCGCNIKSRVSNFCIIRHNFTIINKC